MKVSLFLIFVLLSFITACTTGVVKNDVEMQFGDLPSNPFVVDKDKKGVK